MQGALLTSMLIGLIFGSAIGGLILMLLAKTIGKIRNAGYGNSFLVCFIASAIYYLILYFIGSDAARMGFAGLLIFNIIILSISYIMVGKFVWKCEWMQSVKANIIWIIAYSILIGYLFAQF
jgi:ammonia channel protein AmtB